MELSSVAVRRKDQEWVRAVVELVRLELTDAHEGAVEGEAIKVELAELERWLDQAEAVRISEADLGEVRLDGPTTILVEVSLTMLKLAIRQAEEAAEQVELEAIDQAVEDARHWYWTLRELFKREAVR